MFPQQMFVRIVVLACFTIFVFLLYSNGPLIHGYVARIASHKHGDVSKNTSLAGDKVIVMGKLQYEDTSWVQEYLPEWRNAIYTVDNTSAPLSTPRNKGREANPYLLYIIQNYHDLPSVIAFLHSHRNGFPGGWHTDAPGVDNVVAIDTLNLDFVRRNGYVNMRCQWGPGCPDWVQPLRSADTEEPENLEKRMSEGWRALFGEDSEVPNVIATPCCAQFAVSREQVLKRPLEEYEWYHQWLMETEMSDGLSGRIFEYLWHVIFGMDPVYCPDVAQCYRDVYSREYNSTEWELERQQLIDGWNSTQRVV